jgi:YidC/Oxa1 family membrane protein insertase
LAYFVVRSHEQMKNIARLALCKPEMELITKRWKALGGYSAPPQAANKYQEDLKMLFAKHNCSPGKSMIGIVVQAPLFISFFFALRKMSDTYPSFQTGGMLWFTDLSVVDPTYMLPVVASLTMLASLELGADTGQSMQQQQAHMKLFFRGLSVSIAPPPYQLLSFSLAFLGLVPVPATRKSSSALPPP